MLLRKKELIAASLVILIGVAGYLNWSYQDTISVKDGESYIETGKRLGEAQYVSTVEEVEEQSETEQTDGNIPNASDVGEQQGESEEVVSAEVAEDKDGSYFENARLEREQARAKSLEILNSTAANESFDDTIRQKAGDKIINTAANVEKESEIESIAQSKGYAEICVYIDDSIANVSVRKQDFNENDVTVLSELVNSQTDIGVNNIRIIEVK